MAVEAARTTAAAGTISTKNTLARPLCQKIKKWLLGRYSKAFTIETVTGKLSLNPRHFKESHMYQTWPVTLSTVSEEGEMQREEGRQSYELGEMRRV